MKRKTSVIAEADPAYSGQAAYTPSFLRVYDTIVLRISNRWVWRCPTAKLVGHYEANVKAHHVDAGPGTGYFLDVADLPQLRRLVLIDPNPAVLDYAGRRLARFDPELLEANVLVPIDHPGGADSVACNYVLHCLPGPSGRRQPPSRTSPACCGPAGCSSVPRSSLNQRGKPR